MNLEQWDYNFGQMLERLDQLKVPYSTHDLAVIRRIQQKSQAIQQFQTASKSYLEKIDYFYKHTSPQNKLRKALYHWLSKLAGLGIKNLESKNKFIGRHLWLNVIFSRMNSENHHNQKHFHSDIGLMNMGTRELELMKQEKKLTKELLQLSNQKRSLANKINASEAAFMNQEAASCLQRPWKGKDSDTRLAQDALDSLFITLGQNPGVLGNNNEAYQALSRDLIKETEDIIESCRHILSEDVSPQKLTYGQKRIKEISAKIKSSETKHKQLTELSKKARKHPPKPLHPKILSSTTASPTS